MIAIYYHKSNYLSLTIILTHRGIGWQLDMPPVLYYNNDVHENERTDVHEQTGIGYFKRDPAIPLPEPACAGGAVWVFTGNGKPFGER